MLKQFLSSLNFYLSCSISNIFQNFIKRVSKSFSPKNCCKLKKPWDDKQEFKMTTKPLVHQTKSALVYRWLCKNRYVILKLDKLINRVVKYEYGCKCGNWRRGEIAQR